MFINKKLLLITLLAAGVGIVVTFGLFRGWWQATIFEVVSLQNLVLSDQDEDITPTSGEESVLNQEASPLSGLKCKNFKQRPFAVILAGDKVIRPLSGLSEADIILEMPVLTGGITRYIAIYVCGSPQKIGSLRSARHDFIPLAMGLDAILVHWGGSHYALDLLDAGIMDNIDALPNPYGAFYRIPEIPMPHNGFTSTERLLNAAEKLGYRLENEFEGYPHIADKADVGGLRGASNPLNPPESAKSALLEVGYPYPYNVKYEYNPEDNSYYRWRGGTKQIDKNNNEQLAPKVVVVMRAASRQLEKEYNDLDLEGSGQLEVYQNGELITGRWEKDGSDSFSKLYFLDEEGEEIKFVPGQIWVQVVEPYQIVKWETL